jgi:hypothetical protein
VIRAEQDQAKAWLFLGIEGRTARALGNWYSLQFRIVGDTSEALQTALARALRKIRPRIGRLELYPLAEGDPLPDRLRRAGWLVRVEPASVSWHMPTAGLSFDDYWARRPGQLRNTARRKAKAAALDIRIFGRFFQEAWADYEAVYAASWKPEEGSAAFMRALAEQEGAAGTLRLGIAYKEGRPLAVQLWLTENGIATIHKLAYVADARSLSPGTILGMEMFRHALDVDQVQGIDFGLGDDGYKSEWMEQSAPVNRLVGYDLLSPLGLAAAAGKLVRRWRRD